MPDIKEILASQYSEWNRGSDVFRLAVISSLLCSFFIVTLNYGYHSYNIPLLQFLNYMKYFIILLLGISLYEYYKTKSNILITPIIVALIFVWFADFDAAYRWDAIQHVARAKFFMSSDISTFFTSDERTSFVYLIWGFMYRLFGESEIITNVTNMVIGLAGITGIFIIAKDIYGRFEAVLSVIVALSFPVLFLVNKWAYLDISFVSFVIFSLLFLVKYVKTTNNSYFLLSLIFAFISTGMKEPGFVVFLVIFFTLYGYNLLTKRNLTGIGISCIFSLFLLLRMIQFLSPYIGSGEQGGVSIISPLKFGLDAIPLWLSLLNQEILMIVFSGLLFFSIVAFFKPEKSNLFYISIFIAQVISILGLSVVSLDITLPYKMAILDINYFYILPLCLVTGTTLLGLQSHKIRLNWFDIKKPLILLLWAGVFLSFFIINSHMTGYGTRPIFQVPLLDFRNIIPAFPAMIILFSKGVATLLSSDTHLLLKKSCILIVSAIIITNLIISCNLNFSYASEGAIHVIGYQNAEEITENNVIYTVWPFFYLIEGNVMNIGKFDWVTSNKIPKGIKSDSYLPGSAILFDNAYFDQKDIPFINITTLTSPSLYLDPVLPNVSEKNRLNVSFGKIFYPPYECGTNISFGKNGTAQQYLLSGWYLPAGTDEHWTDSHTAKLVIQLKNTSIDHTLTIEAIPWLGYGALDQQRVNVTINGTRIGEWIFDQTGIQKKTMHIPHDVFEEGVQHIAFELPDAISPKELGINTDYRNLAIGVRRMVIDC